MTLLILFAEYTARVLVLVGVIALGLALVRPALARTRLFVWALVLYAAWLVPLLVMVAPDLKVSLPAALPGSAIASMEVMTGGHVVTSADSAVASTDQRWAIANATRILTAVYLCGAVLLLLRMAVGWRLTSRLIHTAREVTDSALRDRVLQLAGNRGLTTGPPIMESPLVRVPFAAGILRPRIVLPERWRSWDETTLDAVLVHELAHIARRDLWTMRGAAVYRALMWMNPASWWLRRRLEVLAESASDESVLAAGVDRAAYAQILLSFMAASRKTGGRAAWHLAMARAGGVDAERRIAQVLEWRGGADMALTRTKKWLIAAAVAVAALPIVVLTADQTVQDYAASRISSPEITMKDSGQKKPAGAGEVSFNFEAPPAGAPASIVSMTMTVEPGKFVAVSVRNTSTRAIRRVTVRARVTPVANPSATPRVFTSAPLTAWIASGATVELSSGLLDTKSASALATAGPVQATFSILRVEFAGGESWPAMRAAAAPTAPPPAQVPNLTAPVRPEPYEATAPGIVAPVLLRQVNPKYTASAMRGKIEGLVEMKVLVAIDGRVTDVEITKSLDTEHGLDFEAARTARLWLFEPGRLNGQPVATWAVVQMEFRLH